MRTNQALIYRPNNRRLIWTSFICALAIHVTAVVLAENKSKPALVGTIPEIEDVVGVDVPASPPQEDEVLPPEQPSIEPQDFVDENLKTSVTHPRKKLAAVQSANVWLLQNSSGGSAKALALYAPKPSYPYEARRSGTIGSGIAHLTVDSAAGNVVEARMVQSTGNLILDNATLSAFRRWRFKPGVASNVEVPITYTLTGVSY
jgi:TonB family protein